MTQTRRTARRLTRRDVIKSAAAAAALLPMPALAQGAAGRVVVIGGGFAGASCARALKALDARINVTLVEASRTFTACPFSNLVIAGMRELTAQQFGYDKVAAASVTMAFSSASAVDPQAKSVTLADGNRLAYDRLVLAPGIDIRWDGLPATTRPPPMSCRMPGRLASRRRCFAASSSRWRTAGSSSSQRRPIRSAARPALTSARA
jgi:NADPH-dependent 2,4-dienoyl-CoA reductase/sulfur reductase-like enzyme